MDRKNFDKSLLNKWVGERKTIKWMAEQLKCSRWALQKRIPTYKGNKGFRSEKVITKNSINAIEFLFSSDEFKKYSENTLRTKAKKLLIFKNGHVCCVCGLSEWNKQPIPLTCDHIDGNSQNCKIENFRLICANCDRQQPTFGSKNKGRGRIASKKYWLKNKKYYNKKV